MSSRCRDCHFLVKSRYVQDGSGYIMNAKERADPTILGKDWKPECFKGVWSSFGAPPFNLQDELSKPRKEECFFIEWRPGMSFNGATELHRLWYDNRQMKKSQRLSQRALWIATASLVVATLAALPNVYPYLRDFCSYLLNLF